MFTFDANHQFTLTQADLKALLGHGLTNIKVNHPGEISLYFNKKADPA